MANFYSLELKSDKSIIFLSHKLLIFFKNEHPVGQQKTGSSSGKQNDSFITMAYNLKCVLQGEEAYPQTLSTVIPTLWHAAQAMETYRDNQLLWLLAWIGRLQMRFRALSLFIILRWWACAIMHLYKLLRCTTLKDIMCSTICLYVSSNVTITPNFKS